MILFVVSVAMESEERCSNDLDSSTIWKGPAVLMDRWGGRRSLHLHYPSSSSSLLLSSSEADPPLRPVPSKNLVLFVRKSQQQLMMTIWLLSVVVNFLADKRLQMKQKTAQECDCGNDCAWKETMKRLCVWSSHAQVVTACCNAQLMQGTSNITNSLKKKKCVTRDSLKREKIRSVW